MPRAGCHTPHLPSLSPRGDSPSHSRQEPGCGNAARPDLWRELWYHDFYSDFRPSGQKGTTTPWLCRVCKPTAEEITGDSRQIERLTRHNRGLGIMAKDVVRALALCKRACDGGNLNGCADSAPCTRTERGWPRTRYRAFALYRQACDGGDMDGCNDLGAACAAGRSG